MINFILSYNRLGRNTKEADAEEIIDMANKSSLDDQQKQVHENLHSQVSSFCRYMDDILVPDHKVKDNQDTSLTATNSSPHSSGLRAVDGNSLVQDQTAVPETKALRRTEVSHRLKDLMGYTLEVKPSQFPHEDAGKGLLLFLQGEANIGSRIDVQNSHLITRYDRTVINAQPWGAGGESREIWDWTSVPEPKHTMKADEKAHVGGSLEVLERRNPLAFAHLTNHPAKGMVPNVKICPYDFPLLEKDMRPYIHNSSNDESNVPVLKTLFLAATRAICDRLNYRLSNSDHIPSWYTPVDEED
ncbi:unnamed protein product [Withania somnifera]